MKKLSDSLVGTWSLMSRQTVSLDGGPIDKPALGEDPVGILIYDKSGNFSAQFMKRDRSGPLEELPALGKNNSKPIAGYDAYFGTYEVDDESSEITQTLTGSLSKENVGLVVTRLMIVEGDSLTVKVPTTSSHGTPVELILKWKRIG